jgi:hypothetical protein
MPGFRFPSACIHDKTVRVQNKIPAFQSPSTGGRGLRGGGLGAEPPGGVGTPTSHRRGHIKREFQRIHSAWSSKTPYPLCRIRKAARVGRRPCCREQPRLRPTKRQPASFGSATPACADESPMHTSVNSLLTVIKRNTSSFLSMIHASSRMRRATATIATCLPRLALTLE